MAAPGLILGQTIGQIACLLNGDTYGKPTNLPWAITFTDPRAMAPLDVPLHPIQAYELLADGAVFLLVQRVARSRAGDGATVLTYAVAYGIVRFAMEFFRGDPPVVGGIIVPQAVSALLVVAGAFGAWLIRERLWSASRISFSSSTWARPEACVASSSGSCRNRSTRSPPVAPPCLASAETAPMRPPG